MGTGYSTRSYTYSTTDTIEATHTNDEFDALIDTFNASTGHTHDGTTGEGGPITITDTQGGTQYAIPVLNGTGNAVTASSAFSSGQILIGQSGAVPDAKTVSGDITLDANGTVAIASGVIVNADINSSAAIAMSKTALVAGTGLTLSTDTLSVDAAQTQITSVGTIATGTWEATDVGVAHGGTGASTASGARTNLGVAIGSNVQAHGDVLDDLNTLGAATTDGEFIVATGAGAFAYESGATARASLGLTIGTNVQAHGDVLDDLNTLGAPSSDGEFLVATGAGAFAYESGATARTSMGAQAADADLTTIAGLSHSGGEVIYSNSGTWASAAPGATSGVQAYDADTLKADTADVLTAGFATTSYNAGTKSTGTFTPDEANGNFQYAINGGAHTLDPPSNDTNLIIHYTNNGSAGAVSTTNFDFVDGDAYDTTNAYEFLMHIITINSTSILTIKALQ